jgi:hypothetical protein
MEPTESTDTSTDTTEADGDHQGDQPEPERKFTQAEVDRMIRDRLARDRAPRSNTPAARSSSMSAADAARRALAFAQAGYGPDEAHTYALDPTYSAPPPPPRSAVPRPAGAASTTAPNVTNPNAMGALVDVSRFTTQEIAQHGPAEIARLVRQAVDAGRQTSGRPLAPASAVIRRPTGGTSR